MSDLNYSSDLTLALVEIDQLKHIQGRLIELVEDAITEIEIEQVRGSFLKQLDEIKKDTK